MDRATKALIAYGFTVQDDGTLHRGRKDEYYVPTDGGFLHFYRGQRYAFKVKDEFASIAGLDMHKDEHAQFFDMVFPSDWVVAEYEAAAANNEKLAAEAAARKAKG
jgi:hypothetical protein